MKMPQLIAFAALASLIVVGGAYAGDAEVPSFRKATDKETKEFQEKVFMAIVKVARAKPKEPKFDKGEYEKIKEGRKKLTLKGEYTTIRGKADVTIVISLDTIDEKSWEVLKVEYKDTNKVSLLNHNQKNIDNLIPKFNAK